LAVAAGAVAQLALVLLGLDDAAALGANGLLRILIPVAVTVLASRFLERYKPTNLFLYIFISGFFAASFAAVCTMLAEMGLLAWSGQLTPPGSLVELIGYMIMVMFPEGFINGMGIAAMVVFHPDWVETFDADRYLQEPFDKDRWARAQGIWISITPSALTLTSASPPSTAGAAISASAALAILLTCM